jgi:hypothetical protein
VRTLILFALCGSTAAFAGDPVIGVGDEAARASEEKKTEEAKPVEAPAAEPVKPTPETKVIEKKVWGDAERVGKYDQPRWTTKRHFTDTRVYVAPPGSVTAEAWLEFKAGSDGGDLRIRSLYEVSVGITARLQADFYLRLESNGTQPVFLESERIELRYALADWGVLPGNPTLYLEWIRQTVGPQKLEGKLLFGGDFSDRLYWGLNLFYERELWGDESAEYGFTAGISYSMVERRFSLGAEARLEIVDVKNERFRARELEVLVGPSISFAPLEGGHLLLVAYLGPGFEREDINSRFKAQFVFQPTLVGGWRF